MKNITDKQLHEQDTDNLDYELGMQMSSVGPIPKTKKQAAEVIKRIFNSSKQPFYGVGENIPLDSDLNKIKDKVRFFEYGKSFHSEKEGRGFNFEGMLAGLFNGIPVVSKAKEDIIVGGISYSVKSAEPGSSFDSGTLIYGFRNELGDMEDNGVDTTDIKTPYDLLKKEGEEYTRFKIAMLTSMFTSSDGKPIEWIFSIIYSNYIEYTVWSTDDLINELVINPEMIGVGRSPRTDVRMKSRFLMQNPSVIQFPSFTAEELKKLRYNKDRGLKVDKIAELFGKYKTKVRYDVLEYIRKNPQTFLKKVVSLYGDKLGPMLQAKGMVDLNESIDYNDKKIQDLIIDVLHEIVCGDQEPFNINVNEGNDKGHYGHVFSDKIPLEVDNKLYVLVNKLGGITHVDIKKFIKNTNRESIHVLQGLLRDFPSTLQELLYYYGSLDSLRNSDEYKRIVSLIKRIGSDERITEDNDVFGQGLLDPIEPEEFEGEDEEWGKLLDDVEDTPETPEVYVGGKTDAEKGYVAPSKEVTDNICEVEGFCSEQGPITFGQLKALVEEATRKRIGADIGRGIFKSVWRIVPFFIPQVLLVAVGVTVTRAFNKIITPALKDTRGYKSWWGKAVLKAMDVAEGDYIPDVALGDDPLSKIFFISDGLMSMLKDKYKLKFARYVAEYAAGRPVDEPVPEWFVENLLRDYLNQKFLLNPPLPTKMDVDLTTKVEVEENQLDLDDRHPERDGQGSGKNKTDAGTFEPPGDDFTKPVEKHRLAKDREFVPEPDEHSKGGVVETDVSNTAEKLDGNSDSRLQQTINKYLDNEYEIKLIGYPNKEVIRFESKRSGEVLSPRLIIREIKQIFGSGGTGGIMQYLQYMVYLRMKGEVDNVNFQIDEDRTPNYPGSPDSFRSLHRDRVNDDKLEIPPATLVSYLEKYQREKLIKEITPVLECIAYNCYDGWENDPEAEDDAEWMVEEDCGVCSEDLIGILKLLDKELIKLGFFKTGADEFTGVPGERRVNDYPTVSLLEKPFPFTYNDWLETLIQEINPKFYINKNEDIVYMVGNTETLNEQKKDNLNPDVEVGDVIELIYMDDPWGVSPMTKGIVVGFQSMGSMGEKILVRWIIKTEEGEEEFRNLPLIKDVDYWRTVNPLIEDIMGNDDETEFEKFENLMVRAYFNYSGGWGQAPKRFVVYITPSGLVKNVSLNVGMSNRDVPFKEGDKVSLGDLIKFEKGSKFDLQMKGRIREGLLKEQTLPESKLTEMTHNVWKMVQMALKVGKFMEFQEALRRYFGVGITDSEFLWLLVTANADLLGVSTEDLIKVSYDKIVVPELWETHVEYLDDYTYDENEEECVGGYGDESGNECECITWEELEETTTDKDGNKSEVWVDCESANEDTLEKYGYSDTDDCECEEWELMYHKSYYYPVRQAIIMGHKDLEDEHSRESNNGDTMSDISDGLDNWSGLITDDEWHEDNHDENPSWFDFDESRGGTVEDINSAQINSADMMYDINIQFYGTSRLMEQEVEQLKMWPTGQFNFPVGGHLDDDDVEYVEDTLPDNVVEMIFKQWDKKGVDFSLLKMLGVTERTDILAVMLIKRYIQFSQNPIPVSYTFNCDELTELFDTDTNNYNFDYIKEYLCGDSEFNETEDWYNFEWDSYMTDQIDEENWKTIGIIFGGVSQEVAEHILTEQAQNEEEELIEKYEGEIDDIRHYIVWANNDETTYATLNAMGKDIDEKLAEHFDADGELHRDEDGKMSWTINSDLRVWLNDKWDDTEDTFKYHTDYIGETIETIMMDQSEARYLTPHYLFNILVQEEFMMGDYCEGKRGECLQADTRFFDGYWHPNIDINENLADRLGELYDGIDPTPTTIEEARLGGPESPNELTDKEKVVDGMDETPFSKVDTKILNYLSNKMPREDLQSIYSEDETQISNQTIISYKNIVKLFGIDTEEISTGGVSHVWARATRFAKWADDNWDEAERIKEIDLGDDYDDTITYDMDFGVVTNPIKMWPVIYDVEATESYWQKEYKYGSTEIFGYDEEDVRDKASSSWYEYDVDMEYGEGGDTEDHEIAIGDIRQLRTLKESRMEGLLYHTGMLKEMEFDRNELLKLAKNTKGGVRGGRLEVFKFLENLRESGLVNMFQAVDFLWSGKQWLIKYLDFKYPERLEEPDENIQYLLDNADRMRDVLVVLLMDRADREGKTPELDNMNKEIRPLAQDLVKIWVAQL